MPSKTKIIIVDKDGNQEETTDYILFAITKAGIKTISRWDKASNEEELRLVVAARNAINKMAKNLVNELLTMGIPEAVIKQKIEDLTRS